MFLKKNILVEYEKVSSKPIIVSSAKLWKFLETLKSDIDKKPLSCSEPIFPAVSIPGFSSHLSNFETIIC